MLSYGGLRQRALLLQALRSFFSGRGYLEVDTPVRQPILLPEANITPIASDGWYLQTSPEQCMKRLLAVGASQLFQICHCFRAGELGRLHEPEFTMLEWYQQGDSYLDLMEECEQLLVWLSQTLVELPGIEGLGVRRDSRLVDLTPPWPRLTVAEAFARYGGVSVEQAMAEDRFEEVLVQSIEPLLGWQQPVFLMDYPARYASLARRKAEDPEVAERFELYCCGIELANGFSELVDVDEQRARFMGELPHTPMPGMPEKFLDALAALDETAGIALGVDRLLMLLVGADRLAQVVPFAAMEL